MIPHVSWSFGSTFLMISGVQKHSEVVQHGFSNKKHEILMKIRRFSNLRLQDQYLTQNQCFSMVSGNWVGNRLSNTSEMIWKRRFWTCKSILDHLGTSESRKIWKSLNVHILYKSFKATVGLQNWCIVRTPIIYRGPSRATRLGLIFMFCLTFVEYWTKSIVQRLLEIIGDLAFFLIICDC